MAIVSSQQNYDDIFADDRLNIKSFVVDFAHLIEQDTYIEGGISKVYSIAAEFGIGKTFFCEKLKYVLEKDNVQTIKMNIWEMDFYENPLMPILAKLNEIYKKDGENLPAKIINSTLNFTKKSLAVLCETAIKSASNKVLDVDIAEVCKNNFVPENIYDDFKNHQEALQELKQSLIKWAREDEKPIVVIIDELDRCRPDYAVKTLEVLKHFFDVSGFVFVLALDEKQLESSVKCLFGTNNFEGYKRKFINNTFLLPVPDRKAFTEFLYDKSGMDTWIKILQEKKLELVFPIDIYNVYCCAYSYSDYGNFENESKAKKFNQTQTSSEIIKCYFAAYSDYFGFTLREMEQVFERLIIFIKQISSSQEIFSPDLAVFLVCLHEFDINTYNKIRFGFTNFETVIYDKDNMSLLTLIPTFYKGSHLLNNTFNRTFAPEIILINGYSGYCEENPSTSSPLLREIGDNVDRFFIKDVSKLCQEAIYLRNIDIQKLDMTRIKEVYFAHMDFISHFE